MSLKQIPTENKKQIYTSGNIKSEQHIATFKQKHPGGAETVNPYSIYFYRSVYALEYVDTPTVSKLSNFLSNNIVHTPSGTFRFNSDGFVIENNIKIYPADFLLSNMPCNR